MDQTFQAFYDADRAWVTPHIFAARIIESVLMVLGVDLHELCVPLNNSPDGRGWNFTTHWLVFFFERIIRTNPRRARKPPHRVATPPPLTTVNPKIPAICGQV